MCVCVNEVLFFNVGCYFVCRFYEVVVIAAVCVCACNSAF